MNYQHLDFESSDGIVRVGLNRPKVNALNRELLEELSDMCDVVNADQNARVLLLHSKLPHFCAGADLKERRGMSEDQVKDFVLNVIGAAINKIGRIEIPTIAAVNGSAIGGGCELALACDLRILSFDAKIGLRETALGIIPGAGGTQRLPRIIGFPKAVYWIASAKIFSAEQAEKDGVANSVVENSNLFNTALSLAAEIAANAPIAVRQAKKAIVMGLDMGLADGLLAENECYNRIIPTNDRLEALAAFEQKRAPKWTNS